MTQPATTEDRRQAPERRASGERRRQGDGRRVVIEVCRSELHVAIVAPEARGEGELLLCRTMAWRCEAASLLAPGGPEELRTAIKRFAAEERLAGASATILINGDLCVSRVAIGASGDVDQAVGELTDRSQLYLALGAGEKTLATARFPLDARHDHAVVSVANRRTVQAAVGAAEAAGLDLRAVHASAVALCRAHGTLQDDEAPVVVVQLDEDSVEIAVSHRGRLLLEHRPGGRVTLDELPKVLGQHHQRLVRYCRRQGVSDEQILTTGYVAGDAKLVAKAVKLLADQTSLAMRPLDCAQATEHWSLRKDADAPGPQHAAVLGGALSTSEGGAEHTGPNLLERWIAESRKHIRPLLLRSAAPLAATLLVAAGLLLANMKLQHENAVLAADLETLAPSQARFDELRLELLRSESKIAALSRLAETVPSSDLPGFLGRIAGCLPNDVWLDRLRLTGGRGVVVAGASYTESGVYDFVSHLNRAPGLDQVALQETSASNSEAGPTTAFQVKAAFQPDSMTQPAQSAKGQPLARSGSRGGPGRGAVN